MSTALILSTLIVISLTFSSVALSLRQHEVPDDLMERGLNAIGIDANTTRVRNVRISGSQFRTKSMITTIALDGMDSTVVPYGNQTITYSYGEGGLKQRIDRFAGLGTLWVFARPALEPMDYSVVVQDGEDGSAAVIRVFDQSLNISVLFDPDTYLPFAIRTYEDHPFFGPSTNDLRVYDYIRVDGLMIPRHFKIIYNNKRLITDFLADEVSVNFDLEPSFFNVSAERGNLNIPVVDPALTAYIGEKYANYLWFGRFNFTAMDFDAQQPYTDMPGVWVIRMPGVANYRQILLETDNYVVVLDAPSEQALVLLEWVRINIGKPVSQIWPTHHHHDHALGVPSFVENGAEVVVPKMAQSYYANIPGAKFATYERGAPYIVQTSDYRATFIHVEGSIHARDHSVTVIMPACPTDDSTVLVFDADHVVQAQLMATHNDHNELSQLVNAMAKHRVAKSAL
ncbi:hypothetical protein J4E82_001982 [Alternaria postmessia]|uniref:uncharacterized protein n=1 Tax=Alternaria postmessia TaxID=1187938 RepID=UPI0022254BE3|nr:uncharacterized protein J4E82_001982 [Alternaria postmessia]KAI5379465.1 hypothetical protein J4E82_001982 [Alternaria postmessia]